jgi:hypothetical protein
MGMEIQSNMGVSSKELKTSLDELVLVDNPHIFDNLTTLDIKYFMITTPQISTTTEPKMSYDIFYVFKFLLFKKAFANVPSSWCMLMVTCYAHGTKKTFLMYGKALLVGISCSRYSYRHKTLVKVVGNF